MSRFFTELIIYSVRMTFLMIVVRWISKNHFLRVEYYGEVDPRFYRVFLLYKSLLSRTVYFFRIFFFLNFYDFVMNHFVLNEVFIFFTSDGDVGLVVNY